MFDADFQSSSSSRYNTPLADASIGYQTSGNTTDQSTLHAYRDSLLAIRRPKLSAHCVQMELHRSLANLELMCNVVGRESTRNHPQNPSFPAGQWCVLEPRRKSAFHYRFHEKFVEIMPERQKIGQIPLNHLEANGVNDEVFRIIRNQNPAMTEVV